MCRFFFFFFQAEDGIRDRSPSRGLGDVYKRQPLYRTGRDTRIYGYEQGNRSNRVDMILVDEQIEMQLKMFPSKCNLAYLVDSMGIESVKGYPAICKFQKVDLIYNCLLYTSPSPRDGLLSRMPSSA